MKPIYRQPADPVVEYRSPLMIVHPLQGDVTLQEQMRRLHNARAIRRAAQHQRRASVI